MQRKSRGFRTLSSFPGTKRSSQANECGSASSWGLRAERAQASTSVAPDCASSTSKRVSLTLQEAPLNCNESSTDNLQRQRAQEIRAANHRHRAAATSLDSTVKFYLLAWQNPPECDAWHYLNWLACCHCPVVLIHLNHSKTAV